MIRARRSPTRRSTAERPVVLAEQREQPGPQVRFGDALRATFFAGQPLADAIADRHDRDAERRRRAASVRAFHDRWYRPERAVRDHRRRYGSGGVRAAGRQELRRLEGRSAPTPADPDFGKPDPAQPASARRGRAGLPPIVTIAVMRPWTYNDDTVIFNQKRMVDTVAVRLINRRLETRARGGRQLPAGRASSRRCRAVGQRHHVSVSCRSGTIGKRR